MKRIDRFAAARQILVAALVALPGIALAQSAPWVGTWRGEMQGAPADLRLEADGRGAFNGDEFQYAVMGGALLLSSGGQLSAYQFQVSGDRMTVAGGTLAAPLQLARAAPGSKPPAQAAPQRDAGGGPPQELAGKWCYFGSFSALSGGGSMSSECIVLHPNGMYEYSSESSMSAYAPGMYGGTASQSSDRGRWSATANSLTAQSQSGRTTTYRLRKVNHPKNKRDPMVCLDERCYVTYYQRRPW